MDTLALLLSAAVAWLPGVALWRPRISTEGGREQEVKRRTHGGSFQP